MTPSFHIIKMNFTFSSILRRPALSGGIGFLLLILLGLAPCLVHAKPKPKPKTKPRVSCTITGTNPVTVGNTYTYNASGSCTITSWTTTCGTTQNPTSTSVNIYFNQTGCSTATIKALNGATTVASLTVTVNQPPALVTGTISDPSQTINYNTIPPSAINCSAATGGACGSAYSYQWYSSIDNVNFTGISGATTQNYQPGSLTATTYFKRSVNCNTQAGYSTNTAQVTVYPQLVGGSLSLATQTINYNTIPSPLSLSGVTGGNLSYTYQWYSSPNNSTWTLISGQTGTTYTPPALTATTYYQVVVTSNGATASSVSALVTVYPQLSSGTVGLSQAINYNTVPAPLNLSGVSGGSGSYSYRWYYSIDGGNTWTQLTGVTGTSYTPGALTATTEYEVIVSSNGIAGTSGIATITVYPTLVTGTVSPATQTINYNTTASLSVSNTTGGSGSYTFRWQSCLTSNGTYLPISGAINSSYTSIALTTLTYFEVVTTSNGVSVTSAPAVVSINPPLIAGPITPSSLTLATGTGPGLLSSMATGGGCGGAYQYQWQSSTDGVNFSNVTGATASSYNPGALLVTTYYQIAVSCSGQTAYSGSAQFTIGAVNSNLNYIRTRTLAKPGVTDTVTANALSNPIDVQQSTTYFDGLGRSIQTVDKQASPLLNDMVSIQVYDPFGRQATKYLPYTSPSTTGNYKTDPVGEQSAFNSSQYPTDQFFYSQTSFEPSPLNRPVLGYAPGNSWVGSGRGVGQQYLLNGIGDSVQNWTISAVAGSLPATAGRYAASTLYKNMTTDEQGHQVVQYSDLQGRTLLKKVQLAATPSTGPTGWLNTYYVYDTLANLRFVIAPTAVQWLQVNSWNFAGSGGSQVAAGLCFRYEYDYRKRISIKKVPGAGEFWMVYDARDRLVMTQDSNLRAQGKWLVKEYDIQNRPDSTGLLTDSHNQGFHQNLALNSSYYPVVTSYPYKLQTVKFYDNYNWVPTGGPLSSTMNTSYSTNGSYFFTSYNSSPTYAQPIAYFPITRGQLTGTFAYIIGTTTGQVMVDVNFYDDHNRVIQSEAENITLGVDLTTIQYDFNGNPLRTLLIHQNSDIPVQTHTVLTKRSYDPSFRLKSIFKNIDGTTSDQLIDSMQYDELGQLRAKYLGSKVDSLVYAYNIRGWLTGINQNYLAGSGPNNYFGMQLRYNSNSSVAGSVSSNPLQYNGNIAGQVWKTAGDGVPREYDYYYDNANRLNKGNFSQSTDGGATWTNTSVNFSTYGLDVSDPNNQDAIQYDASGNIMSMINQGFKVGGSAPIDVLYYTYQTNSNLLSQVWDGANDSASKLGDFHFNPSTKQSVDYTYDGNGNLRSDNNKSIDSIDYTYLNQPDSVHMKGKGYIVYTYDAMGTKWKKTITDSVALHSTTILYIGGFVYQQNDSINHVNGGADTLQFMAHEEGRARWAFQKFTTGATGYSFQYDFFEKDHLGNTRMVLTQERDTANYLASMEAAYRRTESQLFGNIASTSVAWTSMPNYQSIPNTVRFATTSPNDSVSKVDYTGTGGQTTGPSLLLKVMSGDTVKLGVQCYYASNSITTTNSSFTSVLNSLAAGLLGTAGGAAEGSLSGYTSSSGTVYGGLSSFLSTKDQTPPAGYPKAYLNWIFLDDQFNYVSSLSGSVPAASSTYPAGTMNTVAPGSQIPLNKNGYLYIWVSNETQGWDVFFDNLSVQYKQGPIMEENHYYPFGLTMAGISDKAVKANYAENKYRFNKGTESNDEFNLDWYETVCRVYDPQIGRFLQIDPLSFYSRNYSPYAFANDNPILFNDPLGLLSTPDNPQVLATATVVGHRKKDNYGLVDMLRDLFTHNFSRIDKHPNLKETFFPSLFPMGTHLPLNPPTVLARINPTALTIQREVDAHKGEMYGAMVLLPELASEEIALELVLEETSESLAVEDADAVLGHYPQYLEVAEQEGGQVFSMPSRIFNAMTKEQQWSTNKMFVDRIIRNGGKFRLATPMNKVRAGSALAKEINYLLSKKFRLSADGRFLIK